MQKPLLVSFSGIDGSGKSTQIDNLRAILHEAGFETRLLAFWDNVVVGVRYREGFVHKVYNSEPGVGEPGKPVNRQDKNVRRWYLTIARHLLYLADAINLRRVTNHAAKSRPDVIILDRYIYDELANLNLRNPISRVFTKFITRIVPIPDIAYLLDADPKAACERKPEYPVDFMKQCRRSYFELASLLKTMTVIPVLPLPKAKAAVLKAAQQKLMLEFDPKRLGSDTVVAA